MRTYEVKTINQSYVRHMNILRKVANNLGVVLFVPRYHGKGNDGGTVLFYTQDDHSYNEQLLNNTCSSPYEKYPFFTFEHESKNGYVNFDFARFGGCGYTSQTLMNLSNKDEEVIEEAVKKALALKGASYDLC